jgi:hypothetical protein
MEAGILRMPSRNRHVVRERQPERTLNNRHVALQLALGKERQPKNSIRSFRTGSGALLRARAFRISNVLVEGLVLVQAAADDDEGSHRKCQKIGARNEIQNQP